ncbi:amylo-alpha-1,6-glucosidase [Homoserinibacter gongjuensis]|uniref:amylo-alpha-1,6-glucosidase n=1 Tax=Homoserinibacter gongjuensis TaxID=1162968 RepID=UPI0024E0C04D|nr:hypothetical protein [Homoserinibacter gongjuensis]
MPATAEQPGKIIHEVRRATLELPDEGVELPPHYYGTVDATALWICLLADTRERGLGDDETRELLPALRAALAWMRDFGDSDGDGLLEYVDESGRGLSNQGWKDSGDSVQWRDGSLADGPIALAEVQAYAHEAAVRGAALLEEFGEDAAQWRAWAARLAAQFRASFWVSDADGRYPAIALDARKRPVDSLTSNIGHLLGTGLLDDAEARLVAARLVSPRLDAGYGIRTLATGSGVTGRCRITAEASGRTTRPSPSADCIATASATRPGDSRRGCCVPPPPSTTACPNCTAAMPHPRFRVRCRTRPRAARRPGRRPPRSWCSRRCATQPVDERRRWPLLSHLVGASVAQRAERRHDLPRDRAARAIRADRGCRGPVPREEHVGVAVRRARLDGHPAGLLAQLEWSEVPQFGSEPGGPDDDVGVLERAVGPAHPVGLDALEHGLRGEQSALDGRLDAAGARHPRGRHDRRQRPPSRAAASCSATARVPPSILSSCSSRNSSGRRVTHVRLPATPRAP